MADKRSEFLNKLADLLSEYNAEIYVDLEGDTYGCWDALEIVFKSKGFNEEVIGRLDNPAVLTANEIRTELLE